MTGKPITELAEVTAGGRYLRLADGTIVPDPDQAAPAARSEGGPEDEVGASNGDPPARPEDAAPRPRRQRV